MGKRKIIDVQSLVKMLCWRLDSPRLTNWSCAKDGRLTDTGCEPCSMSLHSICTTHKKKSLPERKAQDVPLLKFLVLKVGIKPNSRYGSVGWLASLNIQFAIF